MRRLYTVETATRTLPYVRAVVEEISERYARVRELSEALKGLPAEAEAQRADVEARIAEHVQRLGECQAELETMGIELKDYDLGLVDFPAELEGREIFLCWRRGEDRVEHWHEVAAGFAGRKPVPEGTLVWPPPVRAASAGRD